MNIEGKKCMQILKVSKDLLEDLSGQTGGVFKPKVCHRVGLKNVKLELLAEPQ